MQSTSSNDYDDLFDYDDDYIQSSDEDELCDEEELIESGDEGQGEGDSGMAWSNPFINITGFLFVYFLAINGYNYNYY